jgi:pantetheine-phosphate adenylyltransferase
VSRTALFPGTFDPVTLGHLDLVRRARTVFARVVVAVSRVGRTTLFPPEERVRLFAEAVEGLDGVEVVAFEGLVVEAARRHGATCLLRGVRGLGDFEAELQMAVANRDLGRGLETLFLPPSLATARVSSTLVREVHALGGDVSPWVPPCVVEALAKRGRPAAPPGSR